MLLHCVASVVNYESEQRVELVGSSESKPSGRTSEYWDTLEPATIPVGVVERE